MEMTLVVLKINVNLCKYRYVRNYNKWLGIQKQIGQLGF
jgi:hypothetical protein